MKLKIYGCRGSMSSATATHNRYGSNTSCMGIEADGQTLILDAGSGIKQLEAECKDRDFKPDILLSHLHLDHTIGLTTFGPVCKPDGGARIFTYERGPRPLHEQIFGAFKPPYWPVPMDTASCAECVPLHPNKFFALGMFNILPFVAMHSDITASFHITDGNKTLVYLLDNELSLMDEKTYILLTDYCRNADLVIFDACYFPEHYQSRMGWGHSTIKEAVKLQTDSGCKQILLTHFDSSYSDTELDDLKRYPGGEHFLLAREGMEIEL
ncbi:MAG: MBL fold metallo-hydrolase [Defluviitaleaceae bacterium]|nr:MBL fold metallo-hydrolase [Defluviitaleaceae bacterium]